MQGSAQREREGGLITHFVERERERTLLKASTEACIRKRAGDTSKDEAGKTS